MKTDCAARYNNDVLKAVIFDMDGVLLDSEPLWNLAEAAVFQKIGVPITREMCVQTMGVRIDRAINYWHKKYPWKSPSKKKVGNMILNEVTKLVNNKGIINRGVKELLRFLIKNKIKIGLASSSPLSYIHQTLKKLSIHHHFHIIHSAENEIHPKPHPAVFLTAAKKLGVKPSECLVIEDSPVGLAAAKKAGMKCVAIVDRRIRNHKSYNLADFKLESLTQFDENLWKRINAS